MFMIPSWVFLERFCGLNCCMVFNFQLMGACLNPAHKLFCVEVFIHHLQVLLIHTNIIIIFYFIIILFLVVFKPLKNLTVIFVLLAFSHRSVGHSHSVTTLAASYFYWLRFHTSIG